MAKKSEIIGEFIITEDDNGSFSVSRIYKSTKKALTEIWTNAGKGEVPKNWFAHSLGRHILNELCDGAKEATIGEYTIERESNNRINVLRTYSTTIEGLRECAESIGMPYEEAWNTRQFGRTLIEFFQKTKATD